jgi:hypothetical protein
VVREHAKVLLQILVFPECKNKNFQCAQQEQNTRKRAEACLMQKTGTKKMNKNVKRENIEKPRTPTFLNPYPALMWKKS